MGRETESFWTDIKRYEDILARDPGSYCFAPLSELYRKVGLLDDAIATASKGIELHPEYVGGYMAIGRAYFEKGETAQSRNALERVVRVTPDNLLAQKLLSQIYIDAGETALARRALETILSLNHEDLESKVALEALALSAVREYQPDADIFLDAQGKAEAEPEAFGDDEELLEEAEIIEDLDDEVIEESDGETFDDLAFSEEFPELGNPRVEPFDTSAEENDVDVAFDFGDGEDTGEDDVDVDPLSTATIAELYIAQGFMKKALKIYRDLLDADPHNEELRSRLVELKHRIDEDEVRARENSLTATMPFGDILEGTDEHNGEMMVASVSPPPAAHDSVGVLEGWLANIGRIRECRSEKR